MARAFNQPQIELVLPRRQVRNQLGLEPGGVVHQMAGMNLEKFRQQQTAGVGEVPAASAFELGKIGLANRFLQLLFDGGYQFALCHLAAEAAEAAFDEAEVADFFPDRHIAICNYAIANCYGAQDNSTGTAAKSLNIGRILW
jgi:hypothetical protein